VSPFAVECFMRKYELTYNNLKQTVRANEDLFIKQVYFTDRACPSGDYANYNIFSVDS